MPQRNADSAFRSRWHLEALVAVAETGSFRQAAIKHGASPQQVRRIIGALEKGAGVALVDRHPRGSRPTALGEVAVAHAQVILWEMEFADATLIRRASEMENSPEPEP